MRARPLVRGANVALTREIPGLTGVVLGVELAASDPVVVDDLVVATLLCDADRQVLSEEHMVFFNQLTSPDLSVEQLRRAVGSDAEQVEIDLPAVPAAVVSILVIAYLNGALGAHRTLSRLRTITIRVLNLDDDTELIRSENLAPALTVETGLVLGELYRYQNGWRFRVVGQGYEGGIVAIAADHGLTL